MITRFFLLLALLLAPISVLAEKSLTFDQEVYHEAFRDITPIVHLVEYLREGDSFEKWDRLLAIHYYANNDDPKSLSATLAASLKAAGSNVGAMHDAAADAYLVYFIDTASGFAEVNVFKYQADPSGEGSLAYQIAKRFYQVPKADSVQALVQNWVAEMYFVQWNNPFFVQN